LAGRAESIFTKFLLEPVADEGRKLKAPWQSPREAEELRAEAAEVCAAEIAKHQDFTWSQLKLGIPMVEIVLELLWVPSALLTGRHLTNFKITEAQRTL
jgi:hypothetical protein